MTAERDPNWGICRTCPMAIYVGAGVITCRRFPPAPVMRTWKETGPTEFEATRIEWSTPNLADEYWCGEHPDRQAAAKEKPQ